MELENCIKHEPIEIVDTCMEEEEELQDQKPIVAVEEFPSDILESSTDADGACDSIRNDFQVIEEREDLITLNAMDHKSKDERKFLNTIKAKNVRKKSKKSKKSSFKQTCGMCKCVFFNQTEYLNHLEDDNTCSNSLLKTHECHLCSQFLDSLESLITHIERHRRNRFFCAEKCGAYFNTLEQCEDHEYDEHQKENIKCNICNHKFPHYEGLKRHKTKMHVNAKGFVCSFCREWFISWEDLRKHCEAMHADCKDLIGNEMEAMGEAEDKANNDMCELIASNSFNQPTNFIKMEPPDEETSIPSLDPSCIKIKEEPIDDVDMESLAGSPIDMLYEVKAEINENVESEEAANSTLPITRFIPVVPISDSTSTSHSVIPNFTIKTEPCSESSLRSVLTPPAAATPIPIKLTKNFKIVKLSPNSDFNLLPTPIPSVSKSVMNATNASASPIVLKFSPLTQVIFPIAHPDKNGAEICPSAAFNLKNRGVILKKIELPSNGSLDTKSDIESLLIANKNSKSACRENRQVIDEIKKQLHEVDTLGESCRSDDNSQDSSDMNFSDGSIIKEDNQSVEISIQQSVMGKKDAQLIKLMKTYQHLQFIWVCPFCKRGYAKQRSLQLHIINVHDISEKDLKGLMAEAKGIRSTQSAEEARRIKRSYICPKCDRACSSSKMLDDHLAANCSRVPQYECPDCSKRFFSSSTLTCHRSIHTGELPFKCDYCEKRFRTRGQVTVHHRTHTGERPFKCDVCSQRFNHRETLISHLSRHIGMKRYKCYGCEKQFSCISGLRTHRDSRPDTCGKVKFNSRAVGPRVRVIKGKVIFEPQPEINPYLRTEDPQDVLAEIQNQQGSK